MVTLQFRQLVVSPGQHIQLQDIHWHEFEAILAELGEQRSSRIAYSNQILEIRMPLPEHEIDKELISDMVKILLEELDIPNECFGSTTFKRQDMTVGIEPDQCFYLENAAVMRGKRRLDLATDPPPDLAIEVDVTSKTGLDAYLKLEVPELWRFEQQRLRISVLEHGQYRDVSVSPHFPDLPMADLVAEFVGRVPAEGRSQTLKSFRRQIQALIAAKKSPGSGN
jgi:Uma2 family endonuclease